MRKFIDTELLRARTAISRFDDDEDIYDTVLKIFLEVYPVDITQSKDLKPLLNREAEDIITDEKARHAAHQLKGSALSLGADVLGAIASKIEGLIKESITNKDDHTTQVKNIEQLKILLKEFYTIYSKTHEEMVPLY